MMMIQFLSLHECINIDGETVMRMNTDHWQIPELVLPDVNSISERAIEIDPHYS